MRSMASSSRSRGSMGSSEGSMAIPVGLPAGPSAGFPVLHSSCSFAFELQETNRPQTLSYDATRSTNKRTSVLSALDPAAERSEACASAFPAAVRWSIQAEREVQEHITVSSLQSELIPRGTRMERILHSRWSSCSFLSALSSVESAGGMASTI